MIVVVLAIVLLRVDAVALPILGTMQLGALLPGDYTVGLGTILHILDVLLTAFQAVGLTTGQATRSLALFDASLLIGFALIDTRRIGLSKSQDGQSKDNGDNGGFDLFHFLLLYSGKFPETD